MTATADDFIQRWQHANGGERANYQLFLTELCALIGLDRPDPAGEDTEDNAYVFERKVTFRHADGSSTNGYIDLYRRGSFVCEVKQTNLALDSNELKQCEVQRFDESIALDDGRGWSRKNQISLDIGCGLTEVYAQTNLPRH